MNRMIPAAFPLAFSSTGGRVSVGRRAAVWVGGRASVFVGAGGPAAADVGALSMAVAAVKVGAVSRPPVAQAASSKTIATLTNC
jgi:hypothetical protein